MNPIRVAIIGCGRIYRPHQMGYRGREDAKIVAVGDNDLPPEKESMLKVELGTVLGSF